jgi:hypothetical protein
MIPVLVLGRIAESALHHQNEREAELALEHLEARMES